MGTGTLVPPGPGADAPTSGMLVGMSELADFLRARRERLTPADVGLPDTGRRRTPGLRREEVATLAGVSIDYLIRLEQGRDTHPSPAVLGALATALRLNDEEKRHLATIGAEKDRGLCPSTMTSEREVPRTVRLLLDRLGGIPAFVTGPYGDILAWTDPFERLVEPIGMLDADVPNLARYVFLHPGARAAHPDWDTAADEQAQRLRTASTRWAYDDGLVDLLAELHDVPEFASRWSTHEVAEQRRGSAWLAHPTLGKLQIEFEVLLLADDNGQRLETWLPADAPTTSAFDSLAAIEAPTSPPQLRVVGD